MPALQLFGAGREKRIYAIPPYTEVKSLDFEDYPFELPEWRSTSNCRNGKPFEIAIMAERFMVESFELPQWWSVSTWPTT